MKQSISQAWMPVGARQSGLGNATVALPDAFAIFSNPASLTGLSSQALGVYADHRYNLVGLGTLGLAYTYPYRAARVGFGVSRYGDELLNQTRAELGLAYKIRMVSLGGSVSYQQFTVADLGTARTMSFQLGGMAELTPKITYGASVYNVTRSALANERFYPVVMRMGFRYLPTKQVALLLEVEKISLQEENFKGGLEYKPIDGLTFRMGLNTTPSQGFLGIGLKWKGSELDYTCSFHSRLGFVHYLGMVFLFKKTEQTLSNESNPK